MPLKSETFLFLDSFRCTVSRVTKKVLFFFNFESIPPFNFVKNKIIKVSKLDYYYYFKWIEKKPKTFQVMIYSLKQVLHPGTSNICAVIVAMLEQGDVRR